MSLSWERMKPVMERLAALRAEQAASGQPTFTCPYCSGPTRYDRRATDQSFPCECCGKGLTVRRREDDSFLVSPGLPQLTGPS